MFRMGEVPPWGSGLEKQGRRARGLWRLFKSSKVDKLNLRYRFVKFGAQTNLAGDGFEVIALEGLDHSEEVLERLLFPDRHVQGVLAVWDRG